jgi:hypothetical protein
MIRGAGRLRTRMDVRGEYADDVTCPRCLGLRRMGLTSLCAACWAVLERQHDAVRDGRHLMPQEHGEHAPTLVRTATFRFGPEYFQTPSDAEIARMEDEGGPPC